MASAAKLELKNGDKLGVDVISLLSNSGERKFLFRNDGSPISVESLRGKFLLICCFFLPFTPDHLCRALSAAYSGLLSCTDNQFEMVVVAKMCKRHANDEAAFNYFFSGFPCLAIPFSDSVSRESVCKSLGLGSTSSLWDMAGVLLDPNQEVVLTPNEFDRFYKYGASLFPFTRTKLESLVVEDEVLKLRLDSVHAFTKASWLESEGQTTKDVIYGVRSEQPGVSLAELLECEPCDTLQSCGGGDKENKVISVAQLGNKECVGVFICCDGLYIERLVSIYQKCLAEKREFEVVVVCLPFGDDLTSFQKNLMIILEKHNISWWLVPYNNEVSRRLIRISAPDGCEEDQLIIMRPGGKSCELRGKTVLYTFGVGGYPFTRESIVEKKLASLKPLALESLLDLEGAPFVHLRGKNVLLYFDLFDSIYHKGRLYRALSLSHPVIQEASDPDAQVEVVFVPLDSPPYRKYDEVASKLKKKKWLMMPLENTGNAKKVFVEEEEPGFPTVAAFGKDGRIRSRLGSQALLERASGSPAVLFAADNLEKDLIDEINAQTDPYHFQDEIWG